MYSYSSHRSRYLSTICSLQNLRHFLQKRSKHAHKQRFRLDLTVRLKLCNPLNDISKGFLTQINDLSGKFNGSTTEMVVQDFIAVS